MSKAPTDWAAVAKLHGLEAVGRELDRVVGSLRALEEVFRPLLTDLPPDLDPATCFRASVEGGE